MAKFSKGQYVVLMAALNKAADHCMDHYGDNSSPEGDTVTGVTVAAEFIADALGMDNPKFDRSHFLAVVRGEKPVNSRPVSSSSSSSSKGMYRVHGR